MIDTITTHASEAPASPDAGKRVRSRSIHGSHSLCGQAMMITDRPGYMEATSTAPFSVTFSRIPVSRRLFAHYFKSDVARQVRSAA